MCNDARSARVPKPEVGLFKAKLAPTFFCRDSVVFARYSDFRYLVVWVCIPGLVNGTASATRAPCGQSP